MSENLQKNPFSGLFTSVSEAESYTQLSTEGLLPSAASTVLLQVEESNETTTSTPLNSTRGDDINIQAKDLLEVNEIVEQVFRFTLSKNVSSTRSIQPNSIPEQLIFLEELSCAVTPQDWIDVDTLEQALFERLLLENPINHAIIKDHKNSAFVDPHAVEKEVIPYLFECHKRLLQIQTSSKYSHHADIISKMLELVSRNAATALKQIDLFEKQELHLQILELFSAESASIAELSSFFNGISGEFLSEDGKTGCLKTLLTAFHSTLVTVHKDMARADLFSFKHSHFKLLQVFADNNELGLVLLAHSASSEKNVGVHYANTLLGSILCLSCLPKATNGEFIYFDKNWGSQDGMSVMEENVWRSIQTIQEYLFVVFHNLLKCSPEVRHKTLCWLGDCLYANASRGRLENLSFSYTSGSSLRCASDGFMINLSGVLLRLCQPFCSNVQDTKLLRIDPTYCAASTASNVMYARGIHLRSLDQETCLIPVGDGMDRPIALDFGFVTECFFMTHRALDLCVRVVMEKISHVNRDMSRIEQAIRGSQVRPDMLRVLQNRLDEGIQKFKSLRASLLEPKALGMMAQLHVATAVWLAQVNVNVNIDLAGQKSFAPETFRKVMFPLPEQVPPTLSCVPELLIENVCYFLIFVRRFTPQTIENLGSTLLEPLLTQILLFMGSIHRMRNPHLRAHLAEALESLIPDQSDSPRQPVPSFYSEQLFKTHPHRTQIIVCLLDVFVGIEMTGQSVEFEQKFNYRRPMYSVMKYLWNIEEQKESFRKLAKEAEKNMEAVTPPLFLRFVNLLINDAVFLLDEALTNMAQLRQMQTARDAGEWERLSPQEREQNENSFLHTGMIARFDNILGRETIQTLLFLTSDITNIFTHPTMVDRIAAMLNYFLYNLVGPKMKNFKVKDQKEFEFEPATIVRFICEIYVHLYKSDSFCIAVSQDGRSYSPQLFKLAEDVLARIGGGVLIVDLQSVAAKVAEMGTKQQTEDELLAEAPEDFLDPIMDSLMTDPVILPSSNKTIDRSTIARHILSDQSDPFNRSPLTMDMVKPNDELRAQIEAWIQEKRNQRGKL